MPLTMTLKLQSRRCVGSLLLSFLRHLKTLTAQQLESSVGRPLGFQQLKSVFLLFFIDILPLTFGCYTTTKSPSVVWLILPEQKVTK